MDVKHAAQFLDVQQRIKEALRAHRRIIWVDETLFTWDTMPRSAWTPAHEHVKVLKAQMQQPVHHAIIAMSAEHGLEAVQLQNHAVSASDFREIFDLLDEQGDQWVLFGDQAGWHTAKEVQLDL